MDDKVRVWRTFVFTKGGVGYAVKSIIDTGAHETFIPLSLAKALGFREGGVGHNIGTHNGAQFQFERMSIEYYIPELAPTPQRVIVGVSSRHPDPIIGLDLLRKSNITIETGTDTVLVGDRRWDTVAKYVIGGAIGVVATLFATSRKAKAASAPTRKAKAASAPKRKAKAASAPTRKAKAAAAPTRKAKATSAPTRKAKAAAAPKQKAKATVGKTKGASSSKPH